MAEKREGETTLATITAAARSGFSKVAVTGFIVAACVLAMCTAPFALAAWWWNEAPTTVVRPTTSTCGIGFTEIAWQDANGRHTFCTPKAH